MVQHLRGNGYRGSGGTSKAWCKTSHAHIRAHGTGEERRCETAGNPERNTVDATWKTSEDKREDVSRGDESDWVGEQPPVKRHQL